jgi:periplasmic copper chaperone A
MLIKSSRNPERRRVCPLLAFCVPGLLLCGGLTGLTSAAAFAASPADIEATQAWIRWLPGDVPSGGYVTVKNQGSEPRTLVSATSAAYGAISLHRTRNNNGVSEMTAVPSIVIAAHASVQLAPGGYHMMLEQPQRALHPGDHVPIALGFSDGSSLLVSFEVRAPNGAAQSDDMSAMPGMAH